MNLPNQLTVIRLFLMVPFVISLSINFPGAKFLALALFIVASVTDYADGYIARKYKLISDFGKLMDPLVDKIMTMAAFICLVSLGIVPAWAVIIIISREFLVTGLRLIAATRGKVLAAERLGKHKTVWQIVTILYGLLLLAMSEQFGRILGSPAGASLDVIGLLLVWFTVGLTLWSGISYFAKNWDLVRDL
jgi:CDP-diacylglycerol--glycerol-3-phosphate 3-phosphatidyltransferase